MKQLLIVSTLALCALGGTARADAGSCRYVPIATLPITFSTPSQQPTIEGSIDGKKATMLVDTGAFTTLILRDSAEKRGLTLHPTSRHAFGVGGATLLYQVHLKDFAVGGASSGKITMPVLGESGRQSDYEAIVGADFLMQADMEIAWADKQLKFYRAKDCADTYLAYWDKEAIELPVSYAETRRNPLFTVQINGKNLTAMIDTGASHSALRMQGLRKLGMTTESPGVTRDGGVIGAGSGSAARYRVVFDSFAIGSETIQNANIPVIDTVDKKESMSDLMLGADFLRAHRILIANSQDRIYLSYLGGDVFAKPARRPAQ